MNEPEKGMSAFAISARAHDLAFVRAVLEASEGLGVITGTADGAVRVLGPTSRRDDLAKMLDDLSHELGFAVIELSQARPLADELEARRGID